MNTTTDNIDSAAGTAWVDEETFREQFAHRLNAALDRLPQVPSGHGRVATVAGIFGISRQTADKWLSGEALPDLWRLPNLARKLGVEAGELLEFDDSRRALVQDDSTNPETEQLRTTLHAQLATHLTKWLDTIGLPEAKRASVLATLARIPGATKTVASWLAQSPQSVALPDLLQFKLLSDDLGFDPTAVLGAPLVNPDAQERPYAKAIPPDRVLEDLLRLCEAVEAAAAQRAGHLITKINDDDSNAPAIQNKAILLVDIDTSESLANGLYVLSLRDTEIVRHVDQTLTGWKLKPLNTNYDPIEVEAVAGSLPEALRIVGRVVGYLQPHWL